MRLDKEKSERQVESFDELTSLVGHHVSCLSAHREAVNNERGEPVYWARPDLPRISGVLHESQRGVFYYIPLDHENSRRYTISKDSFPYINVKVEE